MRPVLIGIPLFGRDSRARTLTTISVIDAPGVTHLRYRVDGPRG